MENAAPGASASAARLMALPPTHKALLASAATAVAVLVLDAVANGANMATQYLHVVAFAVAAFFGACIIDASCRRLVTRRTSHDAQGGGPIDAVSEVLVTVVKEQIKEAATEHLGRKTEPKQDHPKESTDSQHLLQEEVERYVQSILDLYVRSWSSLLSGPNQPPLDAEMENDLRTILTRLADALKALRLSPLASDALNVLRCHLARVSAAMSSQEEFDELALEANYVFLHPAARDEASFDNYALTATEKILGNFGVWQKLTNDLTSECLAQIICTNVLNTILKVLSDPTYLQNVVFDPLASRCKSTNKEVSSVSLLPVASKFPDETDSSQDTDGKDETSEPPISIQTKRSDSKAWTKLSKIQTF